jgi:hypothetical protein
MTTAGTGNVIVATLELIGAVVIAVMAILLPVVCLVIIVLFIAFAFKKVGVFIFRRFRKPIKQTDKNAFSRRLPRDDRVRVFCMKQGGVPDILSDRRLPDDSNAQSHAFQWISIKKGYAPLPIGQHTPFRSDANPKTILREPCSAIAGAASGELIPRVSYSSESLSFNTVAC